ncbi:MAG: hypothetical protein ABIA66_03665 [Candidatus Omnitrophota bacterium]
MDKKRYSLNDLKKLWEEYDSLTGWKLLINGKWSYLFGSAKLPRNLNATKAKQIKLSEAMNFIKFLETKYGKKDNTKTANG